MAKEKTSKNKSEEKLDFHTLTVQGTDYKTLVNKKYLNRKKWEQANDKHILSYIPGTILTLFVKEGDKVKKNQPLLILEAMKMENTIFAPMDGTLKKVNICEGKQIPKGVLMIEFE